MVTLRSTGDSAWVRLCPCRQLPVAHSQTTSGGSIFLCSLALCNKGACSLVTHGAFYQKPCWSQVAQHPVFLQLPGRCRNLGLWHIAGSCKISTSGNRAVHQRGNHVILGDCGGLRLCYVWASCTTCLGYQAVFAWVTSRSILEDWVDILLFPIIGTGVSCLWTAGRCMQWLGRVAWHTPLGLMLGLGLPWSLAGVETYQ